MDFDNFFSFFESHSILAEKQRTKQTNSNSLSFFASLETQDTFQAGIIVEWKKFWQEIPVWYEAKSYFQNFLIEVNTGRCLTLLKAS